MELSNKVLEELGEDRKESSVIRQCADGDGAGDRAGDRAGDGAGDGARNRAGDGDGDGDGDLDNVSKSTEYIDFTSLNEKTFIYLQNK